MILQIVIVKVHERVMMIIQHGTISPTKRGSDARRPSIANNIYILIGENYFHEIVTWIKEGL